MFHVKQYSFLLINPPLYDFAAYDLWAKPWGLLAIAALLKQRGATVTLLDCLDRYHPSFQNVKSTAWGCGHFAYEEVNKPPVLKDIPRKYKRYGLPHEVINTELQKMGQPDVVLVTSSMTYWYPGVHEIISIIKKRFPHVPVFLGGIYATLCKEHAQNYSGACRNRRVRLEEQTASGQVDRVRDEEGRRRPELDLHRVGHARKLSHLACRKYLTSRVV
jgi:hypothetical protein